MRAPSLSDARFLGAIRLNHTDHKQYRLRVEADRAGGAACRRNRFGDEEGYNQPRLHVIGATDEVGLRAAQDKTHVHDLRATIVLLLGFNHRQLTFRHNGRDERLTENAGEVNEKALA